MTHTEIPDLSWLDDTTRRIAELDREFGCNVLDVGGAALTWREVPGYLWARWYDRLLDLGADLPPRPEQ